MPVRSPDDASLHERLRRHVNVLAEVIGERHTSRPANLEGTRRYLTDQIVRMGLQTTADAFQTSIRQGVNLRVDLPCTKPGGRPLVVGAHYDTVFGTPGADDNASAVAILLETLRALADVPLRRPLRAVFYDTEEPPHFNIGEMGSQHDARQRRQRGENLLGMICLESLGYFVRRPPVPPELPRWLRLPFRLIGGRSVVVVANPASWWLLMRLMWSMRGWHGVPLRPVIAPRRLNVINLSDHRSYWDEGFQAVMLTDTALLRNPNYHMATDRLDTLDFNAMTRLCRQVTRGVLRLCR